MSATQSEFSELLGSLHGLAGAGYALGLHIEYTTPKFMFQTYPKAWLDYYSQNGLLMTDPMVAWGFEHTGSCRWSDLDDPAGVMAKASEYGMKYGSVYATAEGGPTRSIGGFARSDREFTDEEQVTLAQLVDTLHASLAEQAALAPELLKQLRNMSIMVTHPG